MPGQYNPETILEEQMEGVRKQLETRWRIEAEALNKSWFSNRGQFDTALARLNSKYQQEEFKVFSEMQQQEEQRQRVQELIAGPSERSRAEEADVRMELGPEEERLVFPQQTDPQDMLRDNLATQNRLMQTTDMFVEERGRLYISKVDDKGYYTGKADKSKPATPEEIQKWAMTGDALSTLEQQEQDILLTLSGAGIPDPSRLQRLGTDQRRKRFFGKLADIGTPFGGGIKGLTQYSVKKKFGAKPSGTFAQKVQRDIAPARTQVPRTQAPRKQSRQELLSEYRRLGGSNTPEGRAFADRNLK